MIGGEQLRTCLAEAWGLTEAAVAAHHGGMNSATWFVTAGDERWVAKAVVPAARRSFRGGLTVAGHVDAAGIPAGAPVPTRHGDAVTDLDGVPLALLRWVDGAALSGRTPDDQRLIGRTLGRVHEVLRHVSVGDTDRFHWLEVQAAHLGVRPWVRSAVATAVAAYEALGPSTLSWGLLHTDPAPEAFRLDPRTGACGLIDWSVAINGPLLYDLASAVMYVGGPQQADCLVEAYLAGGSVSRAEVEHGLPTLLRLRWAVQADYFARRLTIGDLTGIASNEENEKGLADARRWLGVLSRQH
ncbi:phosphotransferase [Micromonospora sp. DR5-3]|uniref:phosphotransferase enzyme family protein n=1 Tax=unclassified Micromonospora TaxID=2617518 RepID=UPI0011D89000|nr:MULTISPECIES: phosphotransferase [unclassified Micromonospora]MCW3816457.1 phosphotransferase [Micromonospora sp. DR5-3]TYC21251.1 phosphotransferase [Micromonospora sp. MP36]